MIVSESRLQRLEKLTFQLLQETTKYQNIVTLLRAEIRDEINEMLGNVPHFRNRNKDPK